MDPKKLPEELQQIYLILGAYHFIFSLLNLGS